jgi:catechol 2,3-dioxygenase-like lactoylglutathione lyase family enzyme
VGFAAGFRSRSDAPAVPGGGEEVNRFFQGVAGKVQNPRAGVEGWLCRSIRPSRDSTAPRIEFKAPAGAFGSEGKPAADYDRWRTRLRQQGIAIESETAWDRGGRSVYFRDPDKHLVELVTPGSWANY